MSKVMLVEDDNNLREIYEARLQAEGYDIVTAHDGEEALVVAKAENPDLVISDVMMPKISGFEMLDILRNTEGLKDVKVIMLTALGQSDDQQRADKLGADAYLVKSQVTLEDIVKVAQRLLGVSDEETEVAAVPVAEVAPILAEPVPAPIFEPVLQAVAPEPAIAPELAPVAIFTQPEPVAEPAALIPEPFAVPPQPFTAPEPAVAQEPIGVAPPLTLDLPPLDPLAVVENPTAAVSPVAAEAPVVTETPVAAEYSQPTAEPAPSAPTVELPEAEASSDESANILSQIEQFEAEAAPAPFEVTPMEEPTAPSAGLPAEQFMTTAASDLNTAAPAPDPAVAGNNEDVLNTALENLTGLPPVPGQEPAVEATASQAIAPGNEAVQRGGGRVITPLESVPKPDLNSLLAVEEAKEAAVGSIVPPIPPTQPLTQPTSPSTSPPVVGQQPGQSFDPNSIAL